MLTAIRWKPVGILLLLQAQVWQAAHTVFCLPYAVLAGGWSRAGSAPFEGCWRNIPPGGPERRSELPIPSQFLTFTKHPLFNTSVL